MLAGVLIAKRMTDAVRVVQQRTSNELGGGRRDLLG
jgi:hypothetical protein